MCFGMKPEEVWERNLSPGYCNTQMTRWKTKTNWPHVVESLSGDEEGERNPKDYYAQEMFIFCSAEIQQIHSLF